MTLLTLLGVASSVMASPPEPEPAGITMTLRPAGRICDRRIRLLVTIQNTGPTPVWIDLEKPPAKLYGISLSTSHCADGGCTMMVSVACGGDAMSFLRSDEATRLGPGEVATWKVGLDQLDLRPGEATVSVTASIASTRDLSEPEPSRDRIKAEATLRLVRKGRCFDVLQSSEPL